MENLQTLLTKEERRLEKIITAAKERNITAPDGSLHVSNANNRTQYYNWTSGSKTKHGKYIPKDQVPLASALAQKAYDKKLLRLAEKRYNQFKRITKDYCIDEIEQIYNETPWERRRLITPAELPVEKIVKNWFEKPYEGKTFKDGMPVVLTDRGERVRSKSEKILADYFYRHGILYKYECPLMIKGYGNIYPDFTFFSVKRNEEIYWEHVGMLDKPEYARDFVRKIRTYEQNDIFLGERLIVTFETEISVLDTKEIEMLVIKYLI